MLSTLTNQNTAEHVWSKICLENIRYFLYSNAYYIKTDRKLFKLHYNVQKTLSVGVESAIPTFLRDCKFCTNGCYCLLRTESNLYVLGFASRWSCRCTVKYEHYRRLPYKHCQRRRKCRYFCLNYLYYAAKNIDLTTA